MAKSVFDIERPPGIKTTGAPSVSKSTAYFSVRFFLTVIALVLGPYVLAQEQTSLSTQIDSYLGDLAQSDAFSGSVLVVVENKTILSKGYGLANIELEVPNSTDTKFRIGSITKQFTSMAILILQEEGRLSVHDHLGIHLSEIPSAWQQLTLHQLLTHTSGLMHSWALPEFTDAMMMPQSLDDILARFYDQPLLFPPGEKFRYSGLGYFVLAKVIEEVSGLEYHKFLQQRIFSPLQMRDTGGDRADTLLSNRASGYVVKDGILLNAPPIYMPILTGGGDLYSTVEDLGRWNRALNDGLFISKDGYEQLYKPELNNYAYGWSVNEADRKLMLSHSGSVSGFVAFIMRVPSEGTCVVILSNRGAPSLSTIIPHVTGLITD